MLMSDLETYRNLQLLNDLLSKGHSMKEGIESEADYEKALSMIDDVLHTDYKKIISKEERVNTY